MSVKTSRRQFIRSSLYGLTASSLAGIAYGHNALSNPAFSLFSGNEPGNSSDLFFKISLAQWSLHRGLWDKSVKAEDFPAIAKEQFGISAVEYVNQFYTEHVEDETFWNNLNQRAKDNGVKNLLIMVDDEGDLGNTNDEERREAVENHYKWVNAAKLIGCHSIRVNGFGEGSREEVGSALIDGLSALSEYADKSGINVVLENHGLYSSDGKWVAHVMKEVGRENCGTLPDFGNFCTARKWGSTQDGTCPEVYDRYLGVKEMMPYAKGVSAKSYRFDEKGQETTIDFGRMLRIVQDAGFTGYIGIEYEGSELSEANGIIATEKLLIAEGKKL